MTRVSTAGNYSAILANLLAAENRQVNAENRVSTQKNGSNLKEYANKAETLTATQRTFLESQLSVWDGIRSNLTTSTAQNGLVQQQLDQVKSNLTTQQNTLVGMIGDITDADMAKAATDLSNAQLSVQATARVLQSLQSTSLLNLLPNG